jgi:hypothetical protein
MKRCPKCNREYRDESLKFCLEDGTPLVSPLRPEPPPTEVLPAPLSATQASVETIPSYSNAQPYAPPPDRRRTNPFLITGMIAIVLLLIALVAIAAIYVIQHSGPANSNNTNLVNSESPSPLRATPEPTRQRAGDPTPSRLTSGPLQITASASSTRLAVQANTYYAANAIDGKSSTAWIEGVSGPGIGEWIRFDFDREINLHRIIIQPGYFKSPQVWAENNRLANVTLQFSDGRSRTLILDDRMDTQRIDVGAIKTRWVRLVIGSVYEGTNSGPNDDTALSEITFEWDPSS